MDSDTRHDGGSLRTQRWALTVVSVLAALLVVLSLALAAFDVFVVLLLCGAIVLLERTVGDWLADELGSTGGKLLFIGLVAALLWGIMGTDQGRTATSELLRAGYDRGFYSAVASIDEPAATVPPTTSSTASAPSAASPGRTASAPSRNAQSRSGANRIPASPSVGAGSGVATSGANAQGGSSGTAVSPSLAGSHTVAQSPDLRAGARHGDGAPPATKAPSRVTVRTTPGDEPRWRALLAEVTSGPDTVAEGTIEFSLNGRVVARVPVKSDGTAEARMANLTPGYYRVTARFVGTDRFLEATSDASFTI